MRPVFARAEPFPDELGVAPSLCKPESHPRDFCESPKAHNYRSTVSIAESIVVLRQFHAKLGCDRNRNLSPIAVAQGIIGLTCDAYFALCSRYPAIWRWRRTSRRNLSGSGLFNGSCPLDPFRVDNVVSNMPEFAYPFGCHKGQAMVHENMCRVW
jgi:hypothetical protein